MLRGDIETHLQDVAAKDRALQALVCDSFDPGRVLREAAELEQRASAAARAMPLEGKLLGVKDVIRARGYPTGCGTDPPAHLFAGPEAPEPCWLARP